MQQVYFEKRNLPLTPPATLAADIAHHLQSRQYLGTTLVVCDNPVAILSAARKQWFKGTRQLQKLRASTLNAEEILRLTHAIMHMQNMVFTSKAPHDCPEGTVFFSSHTSSDMPKMCQTLYVTTPISADAIKPILNKMTPKSLVVDYASDVPWSKLTLQPKKALEQDVLTKWHEVVLFLQRHGVNPSKLVAGNTLQFGAMDEALDILLGISSEFMQLAASFQRVINLAQPLTTIVAEQLKAFEAVTRLAHRVQALTPGNFSEYLTDSFNNQIMDCFFLRDAGSELYEDLAAAAAVDTTQTVWPDDAEQ